MQTIKKLPDKAKERRKTLKKEKEKQKNEKDSMTATTAIIFFYFYFFMQKSLYFAGKHIWKNLVYIATFVLQLFRVTG